MKYKCSIAIDKTYDKKGADIISEKINTFDEQSTNRHSELQISLISAYFKGVSHRY